MYYILAFLSNELALVFVLLIIFCTYLVEKIIYQKNFDRTFLILVFILLFLILCNI
jgi:hypothetical protein